VSGFHFIISLFRKSPFPSTGCSNKHNVLALPATGSPEPQAGLAEAEAEERRGAQGL
jgi:hypothetical protein